MAQLDLQAGFADHAALEHFLHAAGWLAPARHVRSVTSPGAGNMNVTARVTADDGTSFILKQSLPYVAKYPHIAAPETRILSEIAFHRAVATAPEVASRLPELLFFAPAHRLAAFADLGPTSDMTAMYTGARPTPATLAELLTWLAALHHLQLRPDDWGEALANRPMRALNHEHIFQVPLTGDGAPDLDAITPGLHNAATALRADNAYRAKVRLLGEVYLADDAFLLHGDFYPGSWLLQDGATKIFDAEFAFFGRPEFDVGVFVAHLLLAGYPLRATDDALTHYPAPPTFSADLVRAFAGVEVMRRLLGVAQLPLVLPIATKRALLTLSRTLVLGN